jgi:RNA polymerase sigma-70 factor (sigma-E family)
MDPLRRARARAEFEHFAAAQTDGLLRCAFLMVGDRSEAEDVVQECLLRIARKWPRVRSMDYPSAYVRRVMVSLILDGAGQRSRRSAELGAVEPPPAGMGDGAAAAALDARADLLGAMTGLPGRQRAVLVLRYFADLQESEVAEILNCSVGTVKSSASRALERLRQAPQLTTARPAVNERSEKLRGTIR